MRALLYNHANTVIMISQWREICCNLKTFLYEPAARFQLNFYSKYIWMLTVSSQGRSFSDNYYYGLNQFAQILSKIYILLLHRYARVKMGQAFNQTKNTKCKTIELEQFTIHLTRNICQVHAIKWFSEFHGQID